MLTRRVVVCLDVDRTGVVKGVGFRDLRRVGDPAVLAERYGDAGADEIVLLDVSATVESRATLYDVVRRTAERLFVPLTVGGGVTTADDIAEVLRAGADKVSLNTAAVENPDVIHDAAQRFGSQCVVVSIDAKIERRRGEMSSDQVGGGVFDEQIHDLDWYRVFIRGGRAPTPRNAVAWAQQCQELGAGEIMLTSIDRDGTRDGYDLELTARIVERVTIPVIASGGAGRAEHLRDAFVIGGADAALAAGIFHDGDTTVRAVKQSLTSAGVPVRPLGNQTLPIPNA